MFVLAFSAGVPAFTQPEEVHESLSEGVAPLPKEGGGCKALQVGITLAASSIATTTFPTALAATTLAAAATAAALAATAAALAATTIRYPSPNPNPNPPPPSPGRHHR